MANWIYQKLLHEQIERLLNSFDISDEIFKQIQDTGKKMLFHPGEFGTYREAIAIEFLRFLTPYKYAITDGFIITPNNEVSTQCDIIIYDKNNVPLIQNGKKEKFVPIESVVAVGEIKSVQTLAELKKALSKLTLLKKFRSELSEEATMSHKSESRYHKNYSPDKNYHDQIITFLICKEFNFKHEGSGFENKLYKKSIDPNLKHNMVLSLVDGYLGYMIRYEELKAQNPALADKRGKHQIMHYPVFAQNELEAVFMKSDKSNNHIKTFANYIFQSTLKTTVLAVDLVNYMGKYMDE